MYAYAKSDGVYELGSIGDGSAYTNGHFITGRDKMYEAILRQHPKAEMFIASLTMGQKAARKFLIGKGFKQIGKPQRNPNSGNQIAVYVKVLDKKKPAKKKA